MISNTQAPSPSLQPSLNYTNTSQLSIKNPSGQENRRPLLHRVFGGKQQTNQNQQSNSVGAVTRGISGSFGGSNQLLSELITTPQQAAIYPSGQSLKAVGVPSKETARNIGRLPIQASTSAAPASHQSYQHELKETNLNQFVPSTKGSLTSSTERSGVQVQNRSISRARQFGKDLTNMFSFNRQPSRQSTTNAGAASGTANIRHNKGANSANQSVMLGSSLPMSARQNENQSEYYQNPSIMHPTTLNQQQQQRKSSVNPTAPSSQNQIQKSLNSIEFQQAKSKSVGRDGLIRSREKLPEIGLSTKIAMYQQRIERYVVGNIQKVDRGTIQDIYHVSEYCAEIQSHMQRSERITQPDAQYMKRQIQVNENVRAILIDWILNVHQKFKLLPETLFITVNLIDRFLSLHCIDKEEVQLLGVAALLIATKYEEIYPPTVKDLIYITKNAYTRQQILDMEMQILFSLEFQMSETSSYRFLERYSKIAKADSVTFYLAQYLLELALLDSKMNQYSPSLQASAALYVAMRVILADQMMKQGHEMSASSVSCWTRTLQEHTKYTSACLKSCSKNYFQLADLIQKSELQQILKKFMQVKYLEVSRIICNVINTQSGQTQSKQQVQQREARHQQQNVTQSVLNAAHSCDKSTRGGSNTKQIISTPSQFNSSAKHITSKSAALQQMTSGGTTGAVSSAESKKF